MTTADFIVPHNTETAREMITILHDTYGYSWQQIGRVLGVPAGTLWHIANGGKIPRKWKRKLGVRYGIDLWEMPVKELRWSLDNRR